MNKNIEETLGRIMAVTLTELLECCREFVREVHVCPMFSAGGVEPISETSYRVKLQDMLADRREAVEVFLHELTHIWIRHRLQKAGKHLEFEEAIRTRAAALAHAHENEVERALIGFLPEQDRQNASWLK